MNFRVIFVAVASLILLSFGCSHNGTPVTPVVSADCDFQQAGHYCLGYFQFAADPDSETLDVIPMRSTALHLNALPFLEPPSLVYLSLEHLEFNGNVIDVVIGLRHPFLGLTEYTGFDVCGILITNGSVSGFDDADIVMAGENDTRLENPDGYTRWWNPSEFPQNGSIFGYVDGLLGAPDSIQDYNSTLNAYKYFCDDLDDPYAALHEKLDPSNRCVFSSGQKNTRHYNLVFGDDGLIFNYAVDACWEFPTGSYPWHIPDDFSEGANRPEAWNISIIELENSLWNDGNENGGDLSLRVEVWDHHNAEMNIVKVESPGNFAPVTQTTPVDGGPGFSTYQVDVTSATPSEDSINLLVSVASEAVNYGGHLPGKQVTAYFTKTVAVSNEPPQSEWPEEWVCVAYDHTNRCQNPNEQTLDPLNLTQVWSNTTSGSPHGFKPTGMAIADGKVFYVCEPTGYYWPSTNYSIYCLDLNDGHEIWQKYINLDGDTGRSIASPFWYEDKVYVGGDSIYCLDDEDGSEIWTYDAGPPGNYNFVSQSPKVLGGKVFCTSRSAVFVCLDAETGAEIWTYPYEYGELYPVTDGERVYLPSQTFLHCVECETGNWVWTQPLPDNAVAWSGPTIVGDRIYQHGWYGSLYCFDKYDGTLIWTYDFGYSTNLNASPAPFTDPSDGKTVFISGSANSGSQLRAIKDEGNSPSLFWQELYDSSPYYDVTAAILGDYVIEEDRHNHRLLIIDKLTGTLLGTWNVSGKISAQVGIAFNRLVVLTDDSVECFM